jgi:hypothetical protein
MERAPEDPTPVEAALAAYFHACRQRVEPFVAAHLAWPGTLALHRAALGLDLVRAPVNVLLAVPALGAGLAARVLGRLGSVAAASRLARAPLAFQTDVERDLVRRLREHLLEIGGPRGGTLLEHPAFAPLAEEDRARLDAAGLEAALDALLARYAATRRASTDLLTAACLGLAGLLALGRFTPGSLSAGQALAEGVALSQAVEGFWLGPALGGWFYALFPPSASPGGLAGAILAVALLAAACASFAGLLTDPLQARLGIHRRRLRRWLDALERLASGSAKGEYRPWDPYVARLADLADVFRALG